MGRHRILGLLGAVVYAADGAAPHGAAVGGVVVGIEHTHFRPFGTGSVDGQRGAAARRTAKLPPLSCRRCGLADPRYLADAAKLEAADC